MSFCEDKITRAISSVVKLVTALPAELHDAADITIAIIVMIADIERNSLLNPLFFTLPELTIKLLIKELLLLLIVCL